MCSPPGSANEEARPPRNGLCSSSFTRNPASASATPEESPARPPPITITLFEDIRLRPPAPNSAQEDARLLRGIQPHTRGKHIKVALFDTSQQTAIDPRQGPQSRPAVRVDFANEPSPFAIEFPRSFRF